MSTKKDETLWPAEPHTIAKVEILEKYLSRYFQIIGSLSEEETVYVDGFAGPGKYTNHPTGSPIAALKAAKIALSATNPRVKSKRINCIFIEERADRCEFLNDFVEPFCGDDRLNIEIIQGDFAESLPKIEKAYPNLFSSMWSFFFIDPFGPKPVPFSVIRRILQNQKSEILLNLDADGIARIFLAGESAKSAKNLESIFGIAADWPELFSNSLRIEDCARQSLDIYKKQLFGIHGVGYVFAYEMRGKHDLINYFLLFASHHPRGLVKMKEAMKSINKEGGFVFSDARIGQHELFSLDDPAFYAEAMHAAFRGQNIDRYEVERYSLNETPYQSATEPLKVLEKANKIEILVIPGAIRRKSSFPLDKVKSIRFI